jgi:hypothetical protein
LLLGSLSACHREEASPAKRAAPIVPAAVVSAARPEDELDEAALDRCQNVAAEAVNGLPEVKRAMAEAEARIEASGDKLRYGGIGPQDLNAPEGFTVSLGIHSDERFEDIVNYGVDRRGHLTVTVPGSEVFPPAKVLEAVERACKR